MAFAVDDRFQGKGLGSMLLERLAVIAARAATAASLRPMLAPAAVAVIGASRDPSSIGRRVFDALRQAGFKGPIDPVTPSATELDGLACYSSARQLPAGTDLAVIAVPSQLYLESFGNARRFGRLPRRTKPIVAVGAGPQQGRLARGRESHRGSRGERRLVNALFQQSGVIRADTIDEMFDIAACLEAQPLPLGRRVAVVP